MITLEFHWKHWITIPGVPSKTLESVPGVLQSAVLLALYTGERRDRCVHGN